ncbi:hypothetical protein BCR39DRAFT_526256 [Naematelia encephala]|uniref:Ribosomal RNA-processing protein 40 n=1 Tax=Naematelia encephala TaxID=71784 RepID=A0A1Y2B937_9TREE|nr:hypothetical protein BCR39DRAFT_526256 [Naematelia encephala]
MTSLVLPGDVIPLTPSSSSSFTLGPGIGIASSSSSSSSHDPTSIYIATRAGLLRSTKGKSKDKRDSTWVEGRTKRYVPAQKELVLGTIIARHAEGYRVDIGSAQMATLDSLAFEGATKRSKPNLKVGTLVYARVSLASRDMEPELECVDPATGKAEGFGELKGGVMVNCSLQMCRQLLTPKSPLLTYLATSIPFETAIGLNGRIWFKSPTVGQMIALKRVVEGVDAGDIVVDKTEIERVAKAFLA